jgi:hypothetical protein
LKMRAPSEIAKIVNRNSGATSAYETIVAADCRRGIQLPYLGITAVARTGTDD